MAAIMNTFYGFSHRAEGSAAQNRPLLTVLKRLPGIVLGTLLTWQERYDQRHKLMALDDRLLKDIGITRAQAREEYEKPVWRR